MREERNSELNGGRRQRREQQIKSRIEHHNFHRRQREERIAWMKACRKRKQHQEMREHKEWFGIFIILIGLIWLGKAFWGPYPDWLFSWQSLLVAIGLALGFASRFQYKASFVLILVGLVFMAREFFIPEQELETFFWPVVLIALGIIFLIKKRQERHLRDYMKKHPEEFEDWKKQWHAHWKEHWDSDYCTPFNTELQEEAQKKESENMSDDATKASIEMSELKDEPEGQQQEAAFSSHLDDWVNINSMFGGTRRNIISKQFKGGEIINILGGTELDLSRADITGTVRLEITNIMGGIRLAIPPNWQLTYNCTCLMGGTDDTRRSFQHHDPNKTLVLSGTVLMGGIEVKDVL